MAEMNVLVTGATGRTGVLVMKKLLAQPERFAPRGFARSSTKVQSLFGECDRFFFGDIRNSQSLHNALVGCQALVILTSSIPVVMGIPQPGQRPEMGFKPGETPEEIDYKGQIHQIDAARVAGVKNIVLVSSMGGTNPDHMLNKIGNGNILLWKRKAEKHLIDSGISYTIIRAGGLLDQPGGKRELLVGKDDTLLENPPNGIPTSIPREDVAEVVVQSLMLFGAHNKAFDLISVPEDKSQGRITLDFAALFAQTTPGL
jgi:uncharacterized protein YbjT (DUF2867 family)